MTGLKAARSKGPKRLGKSRSWALLLAAAMLAGAASAPASPAWAVSEVVTWVRANAFVIIGSIAFGAASMGLLARWWHRRQDALRNAVLTAVPRPRQLVSPAGKVIYANPAFYDVFGGAELPLPRLLAEQCAGDAVALEELARLQRDAESGVSGQTEIRVKVSQGADPGGGAGEQWRYVAAYPIVGRPKYVYWVVDDITPRRQMEQALHKEQERFVDLLEHAPIGFYSTDGEGRFLFMNSTLRDWLALSPEDLDRGRVRLHDIIATRPPDTVAPFLPFDDPQATSGEVLLRNGSGETFKVAISQDLVRGDSPGEIRTQSMVRDLSREQAMAEALARSEARFRRLFQEAPVGVALIDSDGAVSECNDAFCALLGETADSLRGRPLLELIAEDARPAAAVAFRSDDPEAPPRDARAPIEIGLGRSGETACAMYVMRMDNPNAGDEAGSGPQDVGFVAQFIDTTDQKNLEAQFAQSQKMQAVGQLAGGIAHDFNNLLTAMIGFSDLLLLRHRPGDQSFADIMQIKQNANRAANLVRQLLAFSRQQTLQPRKLNVTDILAELSHLLRRLIGESIELKMRHGRDLGPVKADHGQLEQVIINLVVNARDAMEEGGELTIRTENVTVERERKVKGELMPPGEYVLIEVADNGCGIAPQNLDRIFDPFFSTKEVGAGTGLGLSTVYGIVKQSGGYVFVTSNQGKGTTFSIYLPQLFEEAAVPVASEGAVQGSRDLTGIGKLMLVEDEEGVRAFSARALRNKGYTVYEANSGDTALEVLRGDAQDVDLLITDVVMPRVDGPTLVKEIRGSRPDLKVIFISGYTEDTFRRKLGEEPGIHFLQKPFSLKQLAGKVKEVLEA